MSRPTVQATARSLRRLRRVRGLGAVIALVVIAAACAGPSTSAAPGSSTEPAASPAGPSGAPATAGATAGTTASQPPDPSGSASGPGFTLTLEPIAEGLGAPLDVALRPGHPDDLYVADQVGRVRLVRDGAVAPDPVLDIAGSVSAGGERGLLGLAFAPDAADQRLFVYYTDLEGRQVVSSFRMDPDAPDRAQHDSEQVLLRMEDPFSNHNGGGLAFGPDGYLYIATGDGGGGGDPLGSGRHLDTLLAKVLRIDVVNASPDGVGYAIPADNPYADTAGAMPEIWHTGLRNPWRIRFDRATGDLWIGDVGQGAWEEIDRAPAGVGGIDFGWNLMEGTHCYPSGEPACEVPDTTPPVTEYGHDLGCSITGGTVYRGKAQPALAGWYVFADYCSGRVWAIEAAAAADGFQEPNLVLESGRSISAIAETTDGELVATDLGSGELLHIVAVPD